MVKAQRFAKEWQRLHNSSLFYWELLQELPAEMLREKPGPEAWSLLQIMEHLAGAEATGLRYLQSKQYAVLHHKGLLPAGSNALLLRLALRSPLKFKAPPVLATFTTNTTPAESLLARWQLSRNQLADYLEKIPAGREEALLFKHPRAGALNLRQMLLFMADHLDHHRRQAQKLLR